MFFKIILVILILWIISLLIDIEDSLKKILSNVNNKSQQANEKPEKKIVKCDLCGVEMMIDKDTPEGSEYFCLGCVMNNSDIVFAHKK